MKEHEFWDKLKERAGNCHDKTEDNIVIPVYYGFDDDGNVLIDEDEIRDEFERQLNEFLDITNISDG